MIAVSFSPDCQTTAMGIMPHREIGRAAEVTICLGIPFRPPLPKVHYCEDRDVQALENVPGVGTDDSDLSIDRKLFTCLSLIFGKRSFQYLLAPATFNLTIPVTDFGVSNETNRYYR